MSGKIRTIPNPNKISDKEFLFIKGNTSQDLDKKPEVVEDTNFISKGFMVSMPNFFVKDLTQYLKENPAEGTRSAFIVRVVSEYIKNKTN